MNVNYVKRKDVYYNNTVYKVSIDDLKHINGVDVIKLPNDLIVYWHDVDQKWKKADTSMVELYTNKKYIDVEFNGDLIKCLSYIDLEEEVNSKTITKINIECVVIREENSKIWKIIDKNHPLYKVYTQEKPE